MDNAGMTEVQRSMLDALLDLEKGLNNWELDFIENLDKWVGKLSPRQAEKLEELYAKHC